MEWDLFGIWNLVLGNLSRSCFFNAIVLPKSGRPENDPHQHRERYGVLELIRAPQCPGRLGTGWGHRLDQAQEDPPQHAPGGYFRSLQDRRGEGLDPRMSP